MHQNSILGTCVKVMGRALDAAGCNGPALLAQAGFESRDLDGPDARAPLRKTGRLWKFALAATGDPAFGVKLAQHYTYTTFHSLGYGMKDLQGRVDDLRPDAVTAYHADLIGQLGRP